MMRPRARLYMGLLGGCAALFFACAQGSHTRKISTEADEGMAKGFWLQAESHALLSDVAELESDGGPLELEEPRDPGAAPGFGVGLWYGLGDEAVGLSGLDLGLRLSHFGSGRYRRLESERPVGSMVAGIFDARWRFMERSWGGLYAAVGMGWGGVRFSRELKFDLETQGNTGSLEPLQHGLMITGELGVAWYLRPTLVLRTGLGTIMWRGTLNENNNTELTRTRSAISVGLEWAL